MEREEKDEVAQRALLGALLLDPASLPEVREVVSSPEEFTVEECRATFGAILALADAGRSVDVISVMDSCSVSPSWLSETAGVVPTSSNVLEYARIVHRGHCQRDMALALKAAAAQVRTEDPGVVAHEVVRRLEATQGSRTGIVGGEKLWCEYQEWWTHEVKKDGLTFGIYELDRIVRNGLTGNELVVIGGASSDGKTSLMLSVAWHISQVYGPVLIVSTETDRWRLHRRLNAIACDPAAYRNATMTGPAAKEALLRAHWPLLQKAPIYYLDEEIEIEAISRSVRAFVARNPVKLVCIDYFQMLTTGTRKTHSETDAYNQILNEIRQLRQRIQTPVMLLSQFTKVRIDPEVGPTVDLLRGTGRIENDADLIALLYVPPSEQGVEATATCNVVKQRDGPRGELRLRFIKDQYLYTSKDAPRPKYGAVSIPPEATALGERAKGNGRAQLDLLETEQEQDGPDPEVDPIPF